MPDILAATHPHDDGPPDVLVMAVRSDSDWPAPSFDLPCFTPGCRCADQFELRPVNIHEAVSSLLAVAATPGEGANGGPSSSLPAERVAAAQRGLADAQRAAQGESAPVPWPGAPGPVQARGPVTGPQGTGSDPGVFEIHPSMSDDFRTRAWSWRLRDGHGDVLARGNLYADRDDCRAAIGLLAAAVGGEPEIREVAR